MIRRKEELKLRLCENIKERKRNTLLSTLYIFSTDRVLFQISSFGKHEHRITTVDCTNLAFNSNMFSCNLYN